MASSLFTQEDFIKKKNPQKKSKNNYWYWIIIVLIIVASFYGFRKCSKRTKFHEESTVVIPMEDTISIVADTLIVDDAEDKPKVETTLRGNSNSEEPQNMPNFDLEQMAWSVIRGHYDNNPIRRQKLGEDYQVIQDKVNEFYRKGLVH
jgi:hypothetical protein